MSMLTSALRLQKRGFSVFTLIPREKRPYCGSHGFYDATTRGGLALHWWTQTPEANIGIRTGGASGVFVLDNDPRNGGASTLASLESRHGPLPTTLRAITGSGGTHDYFALRNGHRILSRPNAIGPGLDVKGDKGYVVAPPSIHPNGSGYKWLDEDAPVADPPDWLLKLLLPRSLISHLTEKERERQSNNGIVPTLSNTELRIDAAIDSTLPQDEGYRNQMIFEFARWLKAICPEASASELKCHLRAWHLRALPKIATKAFESTWTDFIRSWHRVESPVGGSPMTQITKTASEQPYPACASDYDSEKVKMLIRLCAQLQHESGVEPFYLTCRAASLAIQTDRTTAHSWLKMLVFDGVLEQVLKGYQGKASRYRYLR